MPPGKNLRARVGRLPVAAAAVACVLAPATASAAAGAPGQGLLSPRLAELAKPSVRSLPPARQARLLSLARHGPGSLLREGNRVLVDVRFDRGAAAAAGALRAAGAKVVNVSRRYQTVTVAARPAELRALASVTRVTRVTEVLTPLVYGSGNAGPVASATTPCFGAATSEGDVQLRAAEAREAFEVDGNGVTVGILSDSFDRDGTAATHASEDVASGDLPGPGPPPNPCGHMSPVNVLDDSESEGADEGRAMAQIVHDLAPGASLAFATAFTGETAFAENIEGLARPIAEGGAGAQVIADDVAYFEEPFFQDGLVADAINEVTSKGVGYFTAAGNDNLIEEPEPGVRHDIASWEAPKFRDSGSCSPALAAIAELGATHCMDFDSQEGIGHTDNTFGITVEAGATLTVDLQWAEPWFGVKTDLDAFLLDEAGNPVEGEFEGTSFLVGSAEDNVSGSKKPVEIFQWENTGPEQEVQLAINRCSGVTCNPAASETATPRLKFILLENGGGVSKTEYPTSTGGDTVGPTIFGHAGSASATSMGAVRYDTTSAPEKFSSRGPVTHYFGPVSGTTPAALISPPETLSKPDIAATDCGVTTFFAFEVGGLWRFCGTSAAAPHAAAVAALMLDANPSLTPAQVRLGLTETASAVGTFGADAVGAGLVNAVGAVGSVAEAAEPGEEEKEPAKAPASPPTITITERPAALSRNRSPSIAFTADRPVSFACSLDGGQPAPCVSPFTPAIPLPDGRHGFAVSGVDVSGLLGTSETVSFTVDTTPPRTFFRRHPRKLIRTRHRKARAAFRFGSNEEGVTFTCRIDGGLPRFCGEFLHRRFRAGRHSVRVAATDAAGNTDRTPAVFRFKVEHAG